MVGIGYFAGILFSKKQENDLNDEVSIPEQSRCGCLTATPTFTFLFR